MHPIVNFPREKAVVKLPPGKPPSPPAPEPVTHMSWAARVSQPPPQQSLRAVSTPIAQTPSWQTRFNSLLRKQSPTREHMQPPPNVLAVASSSREPLDVLPAPFSAAVSLPQEQELDMIQDAGKITSKDVEDEEDLFEDREAGSLPIVRTPRDGLPVIRSRGIYPTTLPPPSPVDAASIRSNPFDKSDDHRAFVTARIYLPGMTKHVTKTLAKKEGSVSNGSVKTRNPSTAFGSKNPRNKGLKSRQVSETQPPTYQSGTKSRQASVTHPQSEAQLSTQPASPISGGNNHSQASTPPTGQGNGQPRAPRNVTHSNRGWKGKQPPQLQAQTAH